MTLIARVFSKLTRSLNNGCPIGCAYCAKSGECVCSDQPRFSPWPRKLTMRQKFERFCDLNPGHHDCKIYED